MPSRNDAYRECQRPTGQQDASPQHRRLLITASVLLTSPARFPIKVDVPTGAILAGIDGGASSDDIVALAKDVGAAGVGGIMVWYASVIDATTGRMALQYDTQADASERENQTGGAWKEALGLLIG
jgi:hypothetical protein